MLEGTLQCELNELTPSDQSEELTGHLGGLPGQLRGHVGVRAGHQSEGDAQLVGYSQKHFSILLSLARMQQGSVHEHPDRGAAQVPLTGRVLHPHFQRQRRKQL